MMSQSKGVCLSLLALALALQCCAAEPAGQVRGLSEVGKPENSIACLTSTQCQQRYQDLNFSGYFYLSVENSSKGCFSKGPHVYFGTGSVEEMSTSGLPGNRERISCVEETTAPTAMPSKGLTATPVATVAEVVTVSPTASPTPAVVVTDGPAKSPASRPPMIEEVVAPEPSPKSTSPSNQPTLSPIRQPSATSRPVSPADSTDGLTLDSSDNDTTEESGSITVPVIPERTANPNSSPSRSPSPKPTVKPITDSPINIPSMWLTGEVAATLAAIEAEDEPTESPSWAPTDMPVVDKAGTDGEETIVDDIGEEVEGNSDSTFKGTPTSPPTEDGLLVEEVEVNSDSISEGTNTSPPTEDELDAESESEENDSDATEDVLVVEKVEVNSGSTSEGTPTSPPTEDELDAESEENDSDTTEVGLLVEEAEVNSDSTSEGTPTLPQTEDDLDAESEEIESDTAEDSLLGEMVEVNSESTSEGTPTSPPTEDDFDAESEESESDAAEDVLLVEVVEVNSDSTSKGTPTSPPTEDDLDAESEENDSDAAETNKTTLESSPATPSPTPITDHPFHGEPLPPYCLGQIIIQNKGYEDLPSWCRSWVDKNPGFVWPAPTNSPSHDSLEENKLTLNANPTIAPSDDTLESTQHIETAEASIVVDSSDSVTADPLSSNTPSPSIDTLSVDTIKLDGEKTEAPTKDTLDATQAPTPSPTYDVLISLNSDSATFDPLASTTPSPSIDTLSIDSAPSPTSNLLSSATTTVTPIESTTTTLEKEISQETGEEIENPSQGGKVEQEDMVQQQGDDTGIDEGEGELVQNYLDANGTKDENTSSSNKKWYIVGGVLAGVAMLIGVSAISREKRRRRLNPSESGSFSNAASPDNPVNESSQGDIETPAQRIYTQHSSRTQDANLATAPSMYSVPNSSEVSSAVPMPVLSNIADAVDTDEEEQLSYYA